MISHYLTDLKKAFDKVHRVKRWEVLKEYETNGWLLKEIKAIYEGIKASVSANTANEQLSEWFDIRLGVRQGCGMSSCYSMKNHWV